MQVNAEKCVQCGACTEACSKAYFKENSPELSRVKVDNMAGFANINICSQCGACIGVCPTKSLKMEPMESQEDQRRLHRRLPDTGA